MMATRESLSVRVADGAASGLSIEDKVKLLAHVAALERLAQAPDAGIEDEMRHHHAEGLSPRLVTPEEMFHPSTHETFTI